MNECKCRSYLYWRKKAKQAAKLILREAEEFAKAVKKCEEHKCKPQENTK